MEPRTLCTELTLAEKAQLLSGADVWRTRAVDRLSVPGVMLSDGPHGMRTQLGQVEGLGGAEPATCFPTATTLATSWDPDLVREVGAAIGAEAKALGVGLVLGPGVNIKRSPRCGRNFEYFSEDPLLAAELGGSLVAGIQSAGVGACVKHFAANNQETDRTRVSAEVSERALREIYLAAFESIITEQKPWAVMCAYNRINGVPASENHWLLTEVLREEWGFDGFVVSDWGAIDERVPALVAGCDLEMPPHLPQSPDAIVAAVEAGELDEAVVDTAVERLLTFVARSCAAGRPALEPAEQRAERFAAHHSLAERAAAEALVLLRNDGVLPLAEGVRLAVVGPAYHTPRCQGDGSSRVNAARITSLADAFAREGVEPVAVVDGFDVEEALVAARQADVVLVMAGLTADEESEGLDRTHLDLPADQLACLAALAEAGTRIVVSVDHGGAIVMPWREQVAAIVDCGLGGQAIGGALVQVLLGRVNPSGRLAETVPLAMEHSPSHLSFPGERQRSVYAEDIFVGYRGYEEAGREVAYPFGFGLSYTTFAYEALTAEVAGSGAELSVRVRVRVTNTGERAGKEVVQVFVTPPVDGRVRRPRRELRAFTKVALDPGESREVELALGQRAFAYWSVEAQRFVVDAGAYGIVVGDQRVTVELAADAPAPQLHRDSSVNEWFAHPEGLAALRAELGLAEGEPLPGMLSNAEMLRLVGDFPLRRTVTQPGAPLTPQRVEAVLARLNGSR